MNELDAHLQKHLQLTAESVARWVEERWGVRYTASGVTALLRRLGYVYKKPKRVPGKANRAAQEAHLEIYEDLNRDKGEQYPIYFMDAQCIPIICNNARYYRSKAVSAYLETSKIELVFLPAYAPNLNLIERFWKFFKKQVLYNRYYGTVDKFKRACTAFFADVRQYRAQLSTLLTENFQITGN